MGILNLFGTVLAGAAITPRAILPPTCTVTTELNFPVSTSIRASTLTYNGPFSTGPFIPFQVSLSTYTVVVPTEGPGGVIQSQTLTYIASPIVDVTPPTSLPSPPLTTDVPNTTYIGCYQDITGGGRPLLYGPSTIRDTQEACQAFCRSASGGPFKYFAITPVSNCQCGQTFLKSGQQLGQCTTGCVGNVTQQCGGPSGDTSIWENDPPIFRPPPGPPDRDPSSPGDGVDKYPGHEPGRPYPKPPGHGKPYPPSEPPSTQKPRPHRPPPSEYEYEDSGYPTFAM